MNLIDYSYYKPKEIINPRVKYYKPKELVNPRDNQYPKIYKPKGIGEPKGIDLKIETIVVTM